MLGSIQRLQRVSAVAAHTETRVTEDDWWPALSLTVSTTT
jgi:hypothetical protein